MGNRMNGRIKLLAEQCYEHDQSWTGVGQRIFNKEKFAQLIVQKCADIGEQYADGNYEVRNQILEHFGIEEE